MTDEDVNPTTEELLNAECEKLAKERDQAIYERNEMAQAFLAAHDAIMNLFGGHFPVGIAELYGKAVSYTDKPNEDPS